MSVIRGIFLLSCYFCWLYAGITYAFVQIGHTEPVTAVAFSPNGNIFVSGSDDNTLKVWAVNSGNILHTFRGHNDTVTSVTFSFDGHTIVSGSKDNTIKLWDVNKNQLLRTFHTHNNITTSKASVEAIAFSPDGNLVALGSHNLQIWEVNNEWEVAGGRLFRSIDRKNARINAVVFSPDGKAVLSGDSIGNLQLSEVTSGRILHDFEESTSIGFTYAHLDAINAVAFSPNGRFIVSASQDKTLKLWNKNGRLLKTFKGHQDSIEAVAFSHDGQLLVSGSRDKTVKLWNVANQQILHTFNEHGGFVNAVAFSPNGGFVISGSTDKTLKLWDITNRQMIRTFSIVNLLDKFNWNIYVIAKWVGLALVVLLGLWLVWKFIIWLMHGIRTQAPRIIAMIIAGIATTAITHHVWGTEPAGITAVVMLLIAALLKEHT